MGAYLRAFLILLAAICLGGGKAEAGEATSKLRLAILDFDSPTSTPWLGVAVAEALAVKLGGLETVTILERRNVDEVLLSDAEPTPTRLGADVVITGHVQLVGAWEAPDSRMRISVKLVSSATGAIKDGDTQVVDGAAGAIFDLETELGKRISTCLKLDAPFRVLEYHEARTTLSKQLFGEGIALWKRAKAKIHAANASPDPETKKEILTLLSEATGKFRTAQKKNTGAFFARAHSYEGVVREKTAEQQQTDAHAAKVRQGTLEQFRKDAAAAAPALYDLGRALQAAGEYDEAITTYDDFLRWFDEASKPFLWEARWCEPLMTEKSPDFYDHGLRRHEQRVTGQNGAEDFARPFVVDKGEVFYCGEKSELTCSDLESGAVKWSAPIRKCQNRGVIFSYALTVRDEKVYSASREWMQIFDRKSGREMYYFETRPDSVKWRNPPWSVSSGSMAMLLFEKLDRVALSDQHGWSIHRLSDGARISYSSWSGYRAFLKHKQSFYVADNSISGICRDSIPAPGVETILKEYHVGQMWPSKDHILLRVTKDRRNESGDQYVRFYPETQKVVPCKENIFFSPYYNKMPESVDTAAVPLVDEATGLYRLIPAKWLYPLLIIKRLDEFRGGPVIRTDIPWVTLKKDSLWIWRNGILRQYDSHTGELKWKKWIDGSLSSLAVDGDLVAIRRPGAYGAGSFGVYRASYSPHLSWPVNACRFKAECHLASNRLNEAGVCIDDALKQDSDDPDANIAKWQLLRRIGDDTAAVEMAWCLVRTLPKAHQGHQRAMEFLQERMGLLSIILYPKKRSVRVHEDEFRLCARTDESITWDLYQPPDYSTPKRTVSLPVRESFFLDGTLYGFSPQREFPETLYNVYGRANKPRRDAIKTVLDKQKSTSTFYRYPDGTPESKEVVLQFDGIDNRFLNKLYARHEHIVVAGLEGHRLAAFDLKSKAKLWERTFDAKFLSLRLTGTRLIAAEALSNRKPRHKLWCLDLLSGQVQWKPNSI